jgi:hypothetical protein
MFNRREMRRSLRMPRWWDAGEQVSWQRGWSEVKGEMVSGCLLLVAFKTLSTLSTDHQGRNRRQIT